MNTKNQEPHVNRDPQPVQDAKKSGLRVSKKLGITGGLLLLIAAFSYLAWRYLPIPFLDVTSQRTAAVTIIGGRFEASQRETYWANGWKMYEYDGKRSFQRVATKNIQTFAASIDLVNAKNFAVSQESCQEPDVKSPFVTFINYLSGTAYSISASDYECYQTSLANVFTAWEKVSPNSGSFLSTPDFIFEEIDVY